MKHTIFYIDNATGKTNKKETIEVNENNFFEYMKKIDPDHEIEEQDFYTEFIDEGLDYKKIKDANLRHYMKQNLENYGLI